MKIFTTTQPKLDFRQKKGGAPQIREKFNQLRFGSNFQGNLRPIKGCDYGENLPHPPKLKLNFKQKREAPQIRQKFNQLGFGSNFQGNPRPMKEWNWG